MLEQKQSGESGQHDAQNAAKTFSTSAEPKRHRDAFDIERELFWRKQTPKSDDLRAAAEWHS